MNTIALRTATAAALIAPVLALGAGATAAATASELPATPPTAADTTPVSPDAITPVVMLPGQTTWQGALGTVLACAPWGLIPLIGPNVAFPICLA